jgi:hypothetical protein
VPPYLHEDHSILILHLYIHCLPCYYSGKFHPRIGHEGTEGEQQYVYSFFNLSTKWGGWSTPRPNRFTPEKETRWPLYRWLRGPQGRSVCVCGTSLRTRTRSQDRPTRSE